MPPPSPHARSPGASTRGCPAACHPAGAASVVKMAAASSSRPACRPACAGQQQRQRDVSPSSRRLRSASRRGRAGVVRGQGHQSPIDRQVALAAVGVAPPAADHPRTAPYGGDQADDDVDGQETAAPAASARSAWMSRSSFRRWLMETLPGECGNPPRPHQTHSAARSVKPMTVRISRAPPSCRWPHARPAGTAPAPHQSAIASLGGPGQRTRAPSQHRPGPRHQATAWPWPSRRQWGSPTSTWSPCRTVTACVARDHTSRSSSGALVGRLGLADRAGLCRGGIKAQAQPGLGRRVVMRVFCQRRGRTGNVAQPLTSLQRGDRCLQAAAQRGLLGSLRPDGRRPAFPAASTASRPFGQRRHVTRLRLGGGGDGLLHRPEIDRRLRLERSDPALQRVQVGGRRRRARRASSTAIRASSGARLTGGAAGRAARAATCACRAASSGCGVAGFVSSASRHGTAPRSPAPEPCSSGPLPAPPCRGRTGCFQR